MAEESSLHARALRLLRSPSFQSRKACCKSSSPILCSCAAAVATVKLTIVQVHQHVFRTYGIAHSRKCASSWLFHRRYTVAEHRSPPPRTFLLACSFGSYRARCSRGRSAGLSEEPAVHRRCGHQGTSAAMLPEAAPMPEGAAPHVSAQTAQNVTSPARNARLMRREKPIESDLVIRGSLASQMSATAHARDMLP